MALWLAARAGTGKRGAEQPTIGEQMPRSRTLGAPRAVGGGGAGGVGRRGTSPRSRAAFSRSITATARPTCRDLRRVAARSPGGRGFDDGGIQQPRRLRPQSKAEPARRHRRRFGRQGWSWNADGTELTFKLHPGVKWHATGKPFTAADVQMHLGPVAGQGSGQIAAQRPRGVVDQPRPGDRRQRSPGRRFHLKRRQPSFPALLASGFHPGLPLPCRRVADAAAPDRHRPVQIRRVQAEPVDQGGEEPGLLEARPALSPRRHRMDRNSQPLDRDPGLHRPAIST